MADLNARLSFTVTNADGTPFADFSAGWSGLPREKLLVIERLLLDAQVKLHEATVSAAAAAARSVG